MKKVKVVQDEASHWYVIPIELAHEFRRLSEKFRETEDYDVLDEFIEKFQGFETGGDLNNVQLYAEI